MAVKLRADLDRCIGNGVCVFVAPNVFDHDDDGLVSILFESPTGDELALARRAVAECPSRALALDEEPEA